MSVFKKVKFIMRTRISDLVNTNFAFEEIDNEQSAVINERQEELALDGETVSNELESPIHLWLHAG